MPDALDKQIRLRATADEKKHLETAAADAGLTNLSDYLRHVLFDNHVLIVGDSNTRFTLVPAFSSEVAEREEAVANLQGLLRLAELAGAQPATSEPEPAALPPEGEGPEQSPVGVDDATPPTSSPVVDPEPAEPSSPPDLSVVPGEGLPAPTENYEEFLARRSQELVSQGTSSIRAGFEADAEWRAQADIAAPAPPLAPVEPAAEEGHGFCGNCGKPLAGTRFCSNCGTPTTNP